MNYSLLDFITLLGAVGMFLYGMKIMSDGLQKIAGDRMRSILSAMTRNPVAGVFTGFLITALIQSSSASTVMVVSFVNAGLMALGESIAVIMGANIGTTATAWIVSFFGFKVDISLFAIPLLAFAVPMMFLNSNKWKNTGEFLVGFSLLFLGLQFINESVPDLKSNPEIFESLQYYTQMGFGSVLLFVAVGVIFTMIIQSSSAMLAIILIMCSKGWIPFSMGCAMALGSNIGTTITPLLASLGANSAAKKAALAHLLFNIFGALWTLAIFYPFIDFITWISDSLGHNPDAIMQYSSELQAANPELYSKIMSGDSAAMATAEGAKLVACQFSVSFGVSMFHTVFNTGNTLILIWFTGTIVKVCNKLIKSQSSDNSEFQLKYISAGIMNASELNITQAEREIALYGERVNRMWKMVTELIHIKPGTDEFNKLYSRIEKYEEISDRMEIEIANYLNKVSGGRLSYESKMRIAALLNVISEIESIADSCYNMAKTVLRKEEARVQFTDVNYNNIDNMAKYVGAAMDNMLHILRNIETVHEVDFEENFNKEREINNYRNLLRSENIENINNKLYEYQAGIYYMDIVCEAEKLGDYIINVVEDIEHQVRARSAETTHE